MGRSRVAERVPVIVLAGHLGAGKTTVLNHLLRQPGSRIGVVVNDFGTVNLDAGLVSGYVDQPAAISGGCLCCIEDVSGLDLALERLASLDVDAILVEASGLADPMVLARMVRFSGAERVRFGGVVDVIDAVEHERTVDTRAVPPSRYVAATLVLINKTDLLPTASRAEVVGRITERVRSRNPEVPVVPIVCGGVDPELLFDVRRRVLQPTLWEAAPADHEHRHAHAASIRADAPASPARLVDLLEAPPSGAYRIKGCVDVAAGRRSRSYLVNLVGRSIHVAALPRTEDVPRCLVAIGMELDEDEAAARLRDVFQLGDAPAADGLRRLRRYLRLSA